MLYYCIKNDINKHTFRPPLKIKQLKICSLVIFCRQISQFIINGPIVPYSIFECQLLHFTFTLCRWANIITGISIKTYTKVWLIKNK